MVEYIDRVFLVFLYVYFYHKNFGFNIFFGSSFNTLINFIFVPFQSALSTAEPAYGRTSSVHLCRSTRQNTSSRLDKPRHSLRNVQSAARCFCLFPERNAIFDTGKETHDSFLWFFSGPACVGVCVCVYSQKHMQIECNLLCKTQNRNCSIARDLRVFVGHMVEGNIWCVCVCVLFSDNNTIFSSVLPNLFPLSFSDRPPNKSNTLQFPQRRLPIRLQPLPPQRQTTTILRPATSPSLQQPTISHHSLPRRLCPVRQVPPNNTPPILRSSHR